MPNGAHEGDAAGALPSNDADARAREFAALYQDLHARAHRLLAANQAGSLNTTGLVHEAYVKLAGANISAASKAHFFHIAAMAMRQILVDHARYRQSQRRDHRMAATLDPELPGADAAQLIDVLALDGALARLRSDGERLAQVVELHFFAGLSFAEIAEMHETSLSTVERDWRTARALLYTHMREAQA
jgi:RNA polymerase sigma factor (TIGR02999 family)